MPQKIAAIPTNLFIDTPEMQDVSLHQLSSDAECWPEEILQKLKERVPHVDAMNTMVKFMKKDPENGAATGSIVLNTPDKSAVVPVIIKDFMMYPLDVMITDKKILPLTPDYVMSVFQTNKVFDKTEEYPAFGGLGRFEDANLWNAIYPPSLGRYAYASAGYAMLDLISDTVDGSEFKHFLQANEKVAMRLHQSGHGEVIKKVASLQAVNMNEFRQSIDSLIPRSVAMLVFDGPNKYTLLQNADQVFSPAITPMRRHQAEHFVGKVSDRVTDDVNEVDRNGEKFLMAPADDGGIFLAQTDKELVEAASDFDHYAVKNKNGVTFVGYVIPRVITFDQEPVDLKIFLSPNMGTIQQEIAGVRVKNHKYRLRGEVPHVGQTGTFVFESDSGRAVATVPVTIEALVVEDDKTLKMKCVDMMGAPVGIKFNTGLALQRIARAGAYYILPASAKWQPMEAFDQVTNSVADYAVKTAGARLTTWPVTVIPTGYGQYAMRGVDKYASACGWDRTCLERSQVKFLLASLGAGPEKIAQVILHAHRTGAAEVHGLKAVPLKGEKVAAMVPKAERVLGACRALRANLWKEAGSLGKVSSVMAAARPRIESPAVNGWLGLGALSKTASYFADSQTVDSLLSLNFVSPENIQKFVSKIPLFKSTISHLCSCLIASRLGIQEIPEQAAASAIAKMVEVVNGLEKLRATQTMGIQ